MQSIYLSRKTLLLTVLKGLVVLSSVFMFSFVSENGIQHMLESSIKNIVAPPTLESADPVLYNNTQAGLPVRLTIPKINVDSKVEYVGLDSDGSIGIPKNRDNVAWFELGQRPGDIGGAVIVGHYGINNKKTSAFDNLHRLRMGDKLSVEDNRGVMTTFIVREIRRYDPDADSSVAFGPNDGKSHLNLITCEGVWDEKTQQYPKRLIVFTDKEVE